MIVDLNITSGTPISTGPLGTELPTACQRAVDFDEVTAFTSACEQDVVAGYAQVAQRLGTLELMSHCTLSCSFLGNGPSETCVILIDFGQHSVKRTCRNI